MPSALRPESSTGTLYHVMVRDIERSVIFRDDAVRASTGSGAGGGAAVGLSGGGARGCEGRGVGTPPQMVT